MNTFEKALARFQEAKTRERKSSMKQHRTKVIKAIEAAMEAETDPQKKVEYAKQLAKLLPRPRQARRPRKSDDGATTKSKGKPSLLTQIHHNGVDELSPVKKLIFFKVIEFEKREKEHRKRTGQQLTEAEKKALMHEAAAFVEGQLTEEDRALIADDLPKEPAEEREGSVQS